jgi:predicted dehydrogenase
MVKAVRATKHIVQIGMQRRSAPVCHRAKRIIDDGMIGQVSMIKPMWNWNVSRPLDNSPLPGKLDWARFCGSAKKEFQPMRFRYWRYFWEFSGGNMTDQGTHLMDVSQWFTNTTAAVSAICYGQMQKNEGSEVPDVFTAVFEYPKHMVNWTLNYCNDYQDNWSITLQGDKGTMVLDEAGCRIYRELWVRPENREPIYQERQGIPLESHAQNFLDCIRSRKEPNCPVEVGASAVSAPHLANIAYKQRRQVKMSEVESLA